jgi:hypothetical protein
MPFLRTETSSRFPCGGYVRSKGCAILTPTWLIEGLEMLFSNMIAGAQKLTVIGAAGLATFPLYEWYDERNARRIERVAGFISAGDICKEWLRSDLIQAMRGEVAYAMELDNFVQLPVQWRANMTIFCAEIFDYLQNDFGRNDEPTPEEYDEYLAEAEFWSSPVGFDAYLAAVHKNPNLAGTHDSYVWDEPVELD